MKDGAAPPGPRADRLAALAETLCAAAPAPGPVRILDIGANPRIEGEVSYRPLLDAGLAELTAVEPQPGALAALEEGAGPAARCLPHVVGDGAEAELRLTRSEGFASLFPPDPASAALLGFARGMQQTGSLPCRTARLDDIAPEAAFDFLKIDVQGAELTILQNGRRALSALLAAQVEARLFPLYLEEPRWGEVAQELAARRLEFLRFAPIKHVCLARRFRKRLRRAAFAQAVDGDAFFVRDLRRTAEMEDGALKRLALIADGIIDAPDLALFALDALEDRGRLPKGAAEGYFERLPEALRRG